MHVPSRAAPELRVNTAGSAVRWDDIMDALRSLDREAESYGKPVPHYKGVLASRSGGLLRLPKVRMRNRGDDGRPLN